MGETVRQIFNDVVPKELYDRQGEELDILKGVVKLSVADEIISLKKENRDLKDEAIALRAADAEKDKMIAEKDKRIDTMQTSYENQLATKLEWQRRQFEEEKAKSLSDQRKNIRSKEVKPEKEKVEAANNERDRIQQMYESLLGEINKSHENEKAILSICSEILSNIKQLINNGATPDELVEKIDSGIKSLEKKVTKTKTELIAEDKKIIQMIDDGMSDSDIADIIYSHLDDPKVRRVQLSKRKSTKRFSNLYNELVGN